MKGKIGVPSDSMEEMQEVRGNLQNAKEEKAEKAAGQKKFFHKKGTKGPNQIPGAKPFVA